MRSRAGMRGLPHAQHAQHWGQQPRSAYPAPRSARACAGSKAGAILAPLPRAAVHATALPCLACPRLTHPLCARHRRHNRLPAGQKGAGAPIRMRGPHPMQPAILNAFHYQQAENSAQTRAGQGIEFATSRADKPASQLAAWRPGRPCALPRAAPSLGPWSPVTKEYRQRAHWRTPPEPAQAP
jgi:hypothetical protein